MRNVYTVKQVNTYIKNMFNQDFMLNKLYVKGEVSNCKYHTSGHIYFSLKDESGTISCVMFAGQRSGLSFRLTEGQQVIALGSVSTYERSGSYQLYAKEIIQDGIGKLNEAYEKLKKELEEMGMFAQEYKAPIPSFAKKIGVITAPTGAAVRDIIQVIQRRNPYIQIVLFPALVQGEGASKSIVQGIEVMEAIVKPDVIIVGRGGGSIEDLWAFNERCVADAIFHCSVPIISAVGHETDFTIADYVADLRAPTPSAAAEMAAYEYFVFEQTLESYKAMLLAKMNLKLSRSKSEIEKYHTNMKYLHPNYLLRQRQQRIIELEEKLMTAMDGKLDSCRHRLDLLITRFKGLSPLEKLSKGYAYISDQEGKAVRKIGDVSVDDEIEISVTDGVIRGRVIEKTEVNHNG